MFQLTDEDFRNLVPQSVTSKWGGRRKLPLAFTEHGAFMAASVLNSDRSMEMTVYLVSAFVQLRAALLDCNLQKFSNSAKLQLMQTTLTINSRGVVTLPAKLRQAMGLKADDQLIAETTPQGLLLRPAVTLPLEIYTPARLLEFDDAEAELATVLPKLKTRP